MCGQAVGLFASVLRAPLRRDEEGTHGLGMWRKPIDETALRRFRSETKAVLCGRSIRRPSRGAADARKRVKVSVGERVHLNELGGGEGSGP
jgi:hypothetical protein